MPLKLYNTLTRQKEEFVPIDPKEAGMYTCGPTVYDYSHIGHIKSYLTWDIAKRSLCFLGYPVKHVMNITDVGHLVSDDDIGEDKMEKGARREGKNVWDVAKMYENQFFATMDAVGIERPDIVCRATEHIPEQIDLVKQLEEKGYTYVIEDGVYFDTSKLSDYGKLARLDKEGLQAGARVEITPGKKNITDFALWKFSYPFGRVFDPTKDDAATRRQMEWESPWGLGFPGWHIECSAMSMKYLGETFDIHGGGVDHIPVHHSNEIAQSEAATGKQFVHYWLHHNHLLVEGQKMSKSLGNGYRLEQLQEKGFTPREVRYVLISSHYRAQQNFTFQSLEQAKNTLQSIDRFVQELGAVSLEQAENPAIVDLLTHQDKAFREALEDDFNIPQALAAIFEIMRVVNPMLHAGILRAQDAERIIAWLKNVDQVLGILQFQFDDTLSSEVQSLLNERQTARDNKNFALSDELRQKIEAHGYLVKDTPQGQKVEKK